jgi:tetratricopeptide (TPR) repeat protein
MCCGRRVPWWLIVLRLVIRTRTQIRLPVRIEEASYRAAIAADPQLADAHYNLGNLLGRRGDLAGAARLFAAALKIDPTDAGAKANLQLALRMLQEERREA